MRLANLLRKMLRLSWTDRRLLLEATFWLALVRLVLLTVPFRRIAPLLGILQNESAAAVPAGAAQNASRIGWSVRTMARRTPWESACLTQAISAKAMLRRRHIHSTLYLGLAKNQSQAMKAHAWLRCGAAILTGEAGHEQFTILSSFAEQTAVSQPPNSAPATTSPELADLLLASLNPVPQPETAIQLGKLDAKGWETVVKIANQQHVLTLFYACLQRLTLETAVPPHLLEQMQQKQQQITLQNLAIYRELRLISEKMQAENIPMIVLKGPYLASAVYPHMNQRAMDDLDLLFPEEQLPQAASMLHTLGWHEARAFSLPANLDENHHLPPFFKKGTWFFIEPHWHIAYPKHLNLFPSALLWQDTVICNLSGTLSNVFSPHLQLLHLAIHASYNHQFAFDLRSLCDIAALINKESASIRWDALVETAKQWGWQRGTYLTLLMVKDFWEVPVPSFVLIELSPLALPTGIVELAKTQLLWGHKNNLSVSVNFSRVKSGAPLLEKIRFVLGFVFPKRSFLSSRYGVNPNSAKIWLYYLINLRDLVKRNARRTWRLLRGQETVATAVDRRNQLSEWLAENE